MLPALCFARADLLAFVSSTAAYLSARRSTFSTLWIWISIRSRRPDARGAREVVGETVQSQSSSSLSASASQQSDQLVLSTPRAHCAAANRSPTLPLRSSTTRPHLCCCLLRCAAEQHRRTSASRLLDLKHSSHRCGTPAGVSWGKHEKGTLSRFRLPVLASFPTADPLLLRTREQPTPCLCL
jgi:hypothetical protein